MRNRIKRRCRKITIFLDFGLLPVFVKKALYISIRLERGSREGEGLSYGGGVNAENFN